MMSQQFCLKWNNHTTNMLQVFENLLTTEALVDVTLACDGLSLKAHKMVLSACSPFFQSLFLENPCKHPIVIMKDMRYCDLKAIIDFMYRGEVNVSHDQLSALLKTAETLKVKGLAEVTGENKQASGIVQQEIIQQNATTPPVPPSAQRTDTPPLQGKRKRGRPRKRSLSDSNRSDDEGVPQKIKETNSDIEELSGDASMEATSDNRSGGGPISCNSQSQVPIHSSNNVNTFSKSHLSTSQDPQVEEPVSGDENEFEVEPSKLLEQTLTTENVPSNSHNSTGPITLPSVSGLEISRRSMSSTDSGSQALVPVSIPSDSLGSNVQGPDSPQDVKPQILSFDDPPISPVAGTSHGSDRSLMMYMDQSGVASIPGPSNFQDNSALVPHDSQPQEMSTKHQTISNSSDIIQVTIHNCDYLRSEAMLLQPAICMHVVDTKTGTYVKKSDRNRAVVSFYENQRNDVDYIMPLMTRSCSGKTLNFLNWDETFILNEEYKTLINKESNIILFFEIVDLKFISLTKHYCENLNETGMRKIAWAFLKPLGRNDVINTGSNLRLQLFKPLNPIKKENELDVEVFKWWRTKTRVRFRSSLFISIEPHAVFTAEPALRSMLPFQQEKGSTTLEKISACNKEASHISGEYKSSSVPIQDTEIIWSRKDGEACLIPKKKKMLLNIVSSCQIIKFSSYGRILAAGCENQDFHYLMFYQIPNGKFICRILAHTELIYDLDWSYDDKYVLSASGDYSVKIWDINCWHLKETFVHPSYVYSAKFHPTCENLFASSCYDHVIRIWAVENCQMLTELEAHNSAACTLCWNAYGTNLYSADVIGQIKVWKQFKQAQGDIFQLENEINLVELKGIAINKMVLDLHKQTLCLFCSDSLARILCLESGQILCSYESDMPIPELSKGCCSPCGNLLFLCCDKGKVSVWNKNSYDKNNPETLYDMNYGDLSCIDYHPHEHMLALSFWNESAPIHVYVVEETEQENTDNVADVAINKCEQITNVEQCTKTEKQSTLSTAVITKTGQFDVIAVPDDSACSDSSTFRNVSQEPLIPNRVTKRAQRRKKFQDMHKIL